MRTEFNILSTGKTTLVGWWHVLNYGKSRSWFSWPLRFPEVAPVYAWLVWEVLPASSGETSWLSRWYTTLTAVSPWAQE